MSAEKTPPHNPTPDPKDPNLEAMLHEDKAAAKKKKRRRWLKVVGIIFALIVLLIVCAPYIASFGFVRSIIVSKINGNLKGSVKLDDYALGWFSGVSAQGLEVYDADKKLVVSIPHVSTQLSLIGAMRGNFDLGDTRIDVKLDNITIDQNGNTNLDSIAKSETSKASHQRGKNEKAEVINVPGLKGKITINLVGGTISGPGLSAPITIDPSSSIVLDIADINQPIKDSIKLAYRVGDSAGGSGVSTISASGSVDAVQDNKIDPNTIDLKLKADQKVALDNVNLDVVNPIVRQNLGEDAQVGGVLSGAVDLSATGITGISANGQFAIDNALFTGGGLKDRLVLDKVSIPIQITRTVVSANQTQIKIEKLGVNSSLANVNITGEVQEEAINNLLAKKSPDGTGTIDISASVPDFGAVARALPRTIDLQKGVEIKNGSLTSTQQIVIARDRVTSNQKLDLAASGMKDNSPIRLNPVHLETAVSVLPRGDKPPSIRDIKLAMTSSFLTLAGAGDSLAAVNVRGKMNLGTLYKEITQFRDLGDLQFSGDGDLLLSTKANGEATDPTVPIDVLLNVNLSNVRLATGAADQTVDQQKLVLAAGGKVLRDAANVPVMFDNGTLSFQAGESGAPVIDVAASAKVDLAGKSVPRFELSKCAISNLKNAQQQFGALLPMLRQQQIQIDSGGLTAQVAGKFEHDTITLDAQKPLGFSVSNLSIQKAGERVLDREDITGKIAGSFNLAPTLGAHLTDLQINSKNNLFAINKSGDSPIDLTIDTSVQGRGAIEVSSDLKRVCDVLVTSSDAGAGRLTSGTFSGTLKLIPANNNGTGITFDGKASDLTITTTGKPLAHETVAINLRASSPQDQSGIDITEASVESRFASAKISDGFLKLKTGTWDMLQKADVDVNVPDLAAVWTVKNAFVPPTAVSMGASLRTDAKTQAAVTMLLNLAPKKKSASPAPSAPTVDDAPLAPLQITRGSASMKLNVVRDAANGATTVELSACNINDLEISRPGSKPYAFDKNISLVMKSEIAAKDSPTLSTMQQIRSLKVTALAGNLGVAKLTMAKPINISGLSDLQTLSADGSIKLEGTIDALTPLLAVLNGKPPLPYSGGYVLNQSAEQKGGVVSLTGDLTATDFKVSDNGQPVFAEKQINLRNDIEVEPKTAVAKVKSITLDMPQTQAVAIKFSGQVSDWSNQRFITAVNGAKDSSATLDLGYDLAKLWPILKPNLSPDMQDSLKDAKIEGKYQEAYNVGGKFPQRDNWQDSLKYLKADGTFALQLFDGMGLSVGNLVVPILLENGLLKTTGKSGAAKPATCNGGTLDISNIAILFHGTDIRVSVPKGQKLLANATINPLLGDTLGKFINPMFANNQRAAGLLNVTINYCDNLGLGDKLKTADSGKAEIAMSIKDMDIANPLGSLMFGKIIGAIPKLGGNNFSEGQADSFKGELKDAVATIDAGNTKTRGTFSLINPTTAVQQGGRQLAAPKPMLMTFDGDIRMSDLKQSINLSVPSDLVAAFIPDRKIGEILGKAFPAGIPIVLKGTTDHPSVDVGDIAKKFIEGQIKSGDIGGIGDILGGGKKEEGEMIAQVKSTRPRAYWAFRSDQYQRR